MTDHEAKQAAYAAKRAAHTRGTRTLDLRIYRVTLPSGQQLEERCIGLSQVAAEHPEAVRVELVREERGAFW